VLNEQSPSHELLLALKQGNERAVDYLYIQWEEKLHRRVLRNWRSLLDDGDATEIVLRTFEKLARGRANYAEEIGSASDGRAWIYTNFKSVQAEYVRRVRKERERTHPSVPWDEVLSETISDDALGPEDILVIHEADLELQQALLKAFESLPPKAQESIKKALTQRSGPKNADWEASRDLWAEKLRELYPGIIEEHYGKVQISKEHTG
jgi:DNA-directed RNA polymerase specialized sigma24 family protein